MKLITRTVADYMKAIVVTMALLVITCGIYGVYKIFKK